MQKSTTHSDKTVVIIGAGPAGLMAAEVISQAGFSVHVYDSMPSVGRKFLMAGKGGLNITHSDPDELFLSRYGVRSDFIKPMLESLNADGLRAWVHQLGITTFKGSSGRIFPEAMKAAPLLRAWLHRLRQQGVIFHVRHQWLGWHECKPDSVRFLMPHGHFEVRADAVVLALGGASWPQLGSTGGWMPILAEKNVEIAPLRPTNCGFDIKWTEYFQNRFAGQPLKSIRASFKATDQIGDCMVTSAGIEGGVIYTLSASLRDEIARNGAATLYLDLLPDQLLTTVIDKFSLPRGKQSVANHLRKRLGIAGVKAGLLREVLSWDDFNDALKVCNTLKKLPITLLAARPISEAISSAGGVTFEALDQSLMLRALPGVFCAGEMLDWEAPTGGYLLTACFASGKLAGEGVIDWLEKSKGKNTG